MRVITVNRATPEKSEENNYKAIPITKNYTPVRR